MGVNFYAALPKEERLAADYLNVLASEGNPAKAMAEAGVSEVELQRFHTLPGWATLERQALDFYRENYADRAPLPRPPSPEMLRLAGIGNAQIARMQPGYKDAQDALAATQGSPAGFLARIFGKGQSNE